MYKDLKSMMVNQNNLVNKVHQYILAHVSDSKVAMFILIFTLPK